MVFNFINPKSTQLSPLDLKRRIHRELQRDYPTATKFIPLQLKYHGTKVQLYLENHNLLHAFSQSLPQSWLQAEMSTPDLTLYWFDASQRIPAQEFEYDPYADYRFFYKESRPPVIIQRDLILEEKSPHQFYVATLPEVTDGFFNVFRLLLPQYFLKNKTLVLHSSCIVNNKGSCDIFLGECNAGKSTVASLSPRKNVLGDDINILHITDQGFEAASAFLGGNPQYKIEYTKRIPVRHFHWLHKGNRNYIQPINSQKTLLRMMMSLFLWSKPQDTQKIGDNALQLITENLNKIQMFDLGFKKDHSFWNLVNNNEVIYE